MKNEEWLNEKLVNFKSHIHENLRPPVDWTPEIKKNVDYVMNMSLDDWLKFASNHLMRFKETPSEATAEICEMYGLENTSEDVKDKITRYIELFIEVLS
jgi:hypothetical protein